MDLATAPVHAALRTLDVVEVSTAAFRVAGQLPGRHLRSLDALHIAVAVELALDVLVTFDQRQAQAAADVGLRVLTP